MQEPGPDIAQRPHLPLFAAGLPASWVAVLFFFFSSQIPCCIQGLPCQHFSQPLHQLHAAKRAVKTRSTARQTLVPKPLAASPAPPVTTSHN